MEDTEMDDKLYYVESTRGQVLGPLNMILILEGIAAGKILESARICEVGQEEWISLEDVAYTHTDAPAERTTGEEASPAPESEPSAPGELILGDLELEFEPIGASGDDEDPEEPDVTLSPDVETVAQEAPEPEESPVELSLTDPAPDSIAPDSTAPKKEREFSSIASFGQIDLPDGTPSDTPSGPSEDLASPVSPAEPSSFASLEQPFGTEQGPASDLPPPAGEETSDFHLSMPLRELEEFDPPEPVKSGGSKKWVLPVVIAIAVPVIAGVFVLTGGKIPFLEGLGPLRAITSGQIGDESSRSPLERGRAHVADGQNAEALAQFRRAVSADPGSAEAHHELGRAALRSGKPKLALKHLQEAVTLVPNESRYLIDLAQGQLRADQPDLAEATARELLRIDSGEPKGHLLVGRSLMAQDDPEGAVRELAAYVEAVPQHRDARFELASAFGASGRLDAALAEVDSYLELAPDDRAAHRARVKWMVALGQDAEAGMLYAGLAQKNPESALHQYLAGLAHPQSEQGIGFLRRATDLDPEDADAFATLGAWLEMQGDADGAALALQRAVQIRPDIAEEYARQIKSGRSKKTKEATPLPAKIKDRPPSELALRLDEVQRALSREDYSGARQLLDTARGEFGADPKSGRVLKLWKGIVDFEQGQFEQALATFESLNPNVSYRLAGWKGARIPSWDVRTWTAWAHFAQGDERSAVQQLGEVGPKNPDEYAMARLWEGIALRELGMNDLAVRTWDQISLDVAGRVSPSGQAALKSAQFLIGAISEKDYRTAVSPVSDFKNDMHFFLGHVASRERDEARAKGHFAQAIDLSRGKEFPFHLAQSQMTEE